MAAKKPGRPRIDPSARSVVVSLTLSARSYDHLYRRAQAARLSVQEVLRRALRNSEPGATETRP